MNAIITDHLAEIRQLCEDHHVVSLYAFGSVTSDRFTEKSDVDFLVKFDVPDKLDLLDHFLDLAECFEKILGRNVDLITNNMLGNPYFIKSVNRSKILVYEREYSEVSG